MLRSAVRCSGWNVERALWGRRDSDGHAQSGSFVFSLCPCSSIVVVNYFPNRSTLPRWGIPRDMPRPERGKCLCCGSQVYSTPSRLQSTSAGWMITLLRPEPVPVVVISEPGAVQGFSDCSFPTSLILR